MARVEDAGIGTITRPQERPNGNAPALARGGLGRAHAPGTPVQRTVTNLRDRLSYLWLGLALVLLTFGTARWSVPLAAWLYPVFLLRFVRTQPSRRGLVLVVLAPIPVLGIAWHGFWGLYFPDALVALVVVLFVLLHALPYLADRVLVPRLGSLLGTLVFPLATTGWWYLFSLVSLGDAAQPCPHPVR
jgi:hypothetical protein